MMCKHNKELAEGFVDKMKIVKMIKYGRSKFEVLRQKVLFLRKTNNSTISEMNQCYHFLSFNIRPIYI